MKTPPNTDHTRTSTAEESPKCIVIHTPVGVAEIYHPFAELGESRESSDASSTTPPRGRAFRRTLRIIASVAFTGLVMFSMACDKIKDAATYCGLSDTRAQAATEIDILCDYGSAPCTPERLQSVTDAALSQVALRPGSTIRVWWLGNSVGETTLIATVTVPPSRGASLRARDAHREHVISEGRAIVEKASAPFFTDFARKKSPVIESIGKIALAGGGNTREIWVVSDLLEESLYRFECGALPDDDSFRRTVGPILPQDSLRNVTVCAVYASPDTIDGDRCSVSVERFRTITTLYESAIAQAGGRFQLSTSAAPLIGGQQ